MLSVSFRLRITLIYVTGCQKITNDGSHAVCDAVFTVSAGMTKIINADLSPYYIFAVAVVGEHHIMQSFQDAQQNVNAGNQRCNFARFPCRILLRRPYAVGQSTYCFCYRIQR